MLSVTKCIDIEIIMPSEVKEKKDKQYDITYMWNPKYDTNEPIYKVEMDSQTQGTDLQLASVGVRQEGLEVWG